ncbi:MAG: hypothetical protein LWY06_04120 [Firmicutes bacterium]|nr:hypothetical protein [Bacillota bacterium]
MKKVMIVGLILMFGLVLMLGCNPSQPTQPQGEQKPASAPASTEAPPPAPAPNPTGGAAQTPSAPPANDLPYLFTKVIFSADKNAKDEALTEDTKMIFDENVGVIAVKIEKNKDIPKGKEFDFVISHNGKDVDQFAVKAEELADKDNIRRIKAEKDKYAPGPYEVQITEKDTGKKVILHFAVGAPPKGEPGKGPVEPNMEPGKGPKPGEPGMEPGKGPKPGEPGKPGMEPGKGPDKGGNDVDKDEPGDDKGTGTDDKKDDK